MQYEKWHSLVEDNIALVKYIIAKDFKLAYNRGNILTKEEAINEALLKLCEVAKKYVESGNTKPFNSYMIRSIKNTILQLLRAEKAEKRDVKKLSTNTILDTITVRQANNERNYINKDYCKVLLQKTPLDKTTKKILKLFYWDGMSYKEIVGKLGISWMQVHYKLNQAKTALKEKACEIS